MSPVEWISALIALGSVIAALIVIFMMRSEKRKTSKKPVEQPKLEPEMYLPIKTKRSVTHDETEDAKNKLRILSLEKEILSYAIRRLYEAQAEGKINEEERNGLTEKYKEDMKRINEEISRGESIITLSELETMQQDLFKLFNDRFDELNKRIEEMRLRSGIEEIEPAEPIEEEQPALTTPSEPRAPARERRKREPSKKEPSAPAAPEKSEAERKVEQIMTEVEKVLDRLEQMETSE